MYQAVCIYLKGSVRVVLQTFCHASPKTFLDLPHKLKLQLLFVHLDVCWKEEGACIQFSHRLDTPL